jgi:hypothetical protein
MKRTAGLDRVKDISSIVHPANGAGKIPPLEQGDRLTRHEFELRYEAMPELKKAELIEGVVYIGSPVQYKHGRHHRQMNHWLSAYCVVTPGTDVADNVTNRLDEDNDPQPDLLLRIEEDYGGQSWIDEDGYLSNPNFSTLIQIDRQTDGLQPCACRLARVFPARTLAEAARAAASAGLVRSPDTAPPTPRPGGSGDLRFLVCRTCCQAGAARKPCSTRPNSAARGQALDSATVIRRTLTRTTPPILHRARRIVPQ